MVSSFGGNEICFRDFPSGKGSNKNVSDVSVSARTSAVGYKDPML